MQDMFSAVRYFFLFFIFFGQTQKLLLQSSKQKNPSKFWLQYMCTLAQILIRQIAP